MERFDYSDEILSELDLGRDQLCELVSPGAVLGELRTDPILAELTQEQRAYARERNILGWRGVPNALL